MKPELIATLGNYDRRAFARDALASLTVALVAIPVSVAIAIASGASPQSGLITAFVGGFLISALGGSKVQIGGATGAFIVTVYSIVERFGHEGLILACMMAGCILVLGAFLRLGRLIRYVPMAVVEGFTIGIALLIVVSQLASLTGIHHLPVAPDLPTAIEALWQQRDRIEPESLALGVATMAVILGMRRIAPIIPWRVVAVAVASVVAAFALPQVETVSSAFGALENGWPRVHWPHITFEKLGLLFPSALIIAFLAAVESLLSAIVADRVLGTRHHSNAELLAQGAANIFSPLFGGLPVGGAVARTTTNIVAGARSPLSGMMAAIWMLFVMLVGAPLAGAMALPALSAVLIVTAWTMTEPHRWAERFRMARSDQFLLALTAFLTVFVNLGAAIATGTILGLALRLSRGEIEPPHWHTPFRWGGLHRMQVYPRMAMRMARRRFHLPWR